MLLYDVFIYTWQVQPMLVVPSLMAYIQTLQVLTLSLIVLNNMSHVDENRIIDICRTCIQ